jgi:hypothetical protein
LFQPFGSQALIEFRLVGSGYVEAVRPAAQNKILHRIILTV